MKYIKKNSIVEAEQYHGPPVIKTFKEASGSTINFTIKDGDWLINNKEWVSPTVFDLLYEPL